MNSQTRDQWLTKNTALVNELYDLNNQLCLIADGTYLYCQKSENNKVQRLLYSGQKKRHLIKPFIVCTANGFIVDAYGPFAATVNDASILSYLLDHSNLKELLVKNDVIVLDRGFRDVLHTLKSVHGVIPKIPACMFSSLFLFLIMSFHLILQGLANKSVQLTRLQANETRLVTKIRWVIEDVNGVLKQSFRAFDGTIQNKMLTHIMNDLRIACSLVNCFFTRKISDEEDGVQIAYEMKEKVSLKNDLERYLSKKSTTKFLKLESDDLNDFPKMDPNEIRKKITFGWYQINQCLGYIAKHLDEKGDFEFHIEKSTDKEGSLKVVSSKFFSRHSNNYEYSVYVKYMPNAKNSEYMSWVCSCMSGLRTCGCCSHVASFIYYLSFARFQSDPLKKPGCSLDRVLISLNKDEFSDDDSNKDDAIETPTQILLNDDDLKSATATNDIDEVDIVSQLVNITKSDSKKKRNLSSNESTQHSKISSSLKLSIEKSNDKIKSSQTKNYVSSFDNNISFREFTSHIPRWGGVIEANEVDFFSSEEFSTLSEYANLVYEDTCTIDYFLLALWAITKLSKEVLPAVELNMENKVAKYFKKIVNLIENKEWNRARTLWILSILERTPVDWKFSLFGNQMDCFVNYFLPLQELGFYCVACKLHTNYSTTEYFFKKDKENRVFIYSRLEESCHSCGMSIKGRFKLQPFCVFFSILDNLHLTEIPSSVEIDKTRFNLICLTFHSINRDISHFKSIFYLQKSFYMVDDLIPNQVIKKFPNELNITYILYYRA